jgi:inhibitor of KinA
MSEGRIVALGDACVAIEFESTIEPRVNARCVALAATLERRALVGVRDVVTSYNAVTVHFDPVAVDRRALSAEIIELAASQATGPEPGTRTVDVPVSYGGDEGPDLSVLAGFARCSEDEVVRLHTAAPYRVYMLGFLPGFAYMGPVDARIRMPRLDAPRPRVVAGSVGIAGSQTGVYPCDTPGGWRIIGRTRLKLFDPTRAEPFLLKTGDHVRFVVA